MTNQRIAQLTFAVCVCLNIPANAQSPNFESYPVAVEYYPQTTVFEEVWYPTEPTGCGESSESDSQPVTVHDGDNAQPAAVAAVDSPVAPVATTPEVVTPEIEIAEEATDRTPAFSVQPQEDTDTDFTLDQPELDFKFASPQAYELHLYEQWASYGEDVSAEKTELPSVENDEPVATVEEDEVQEEVVTVVDEPQTPVESREEEVAAVVEKEVAPVASIDEHQDYHVIKDTCDLPECELQESYESFVATEPVSTAAESSEAVVATVEPEVVTAAPVTTKVAPVKVATAATKSRVAAAKTEKAGGLWAWWPCLLLPLVGWGGWRLYAGKKREANYELYGGTSALASPVAKRQNETVRAVNTVKTQSMVASRATAAAGLVATGAVAKNSTAAQPVSTTYRSADAQEKSSPKKGTSYTQPTTTYSTASETTYPVVPEGEVAEGFSAKPQAVQGEAKRSTQKVSGTSKNSDDLTQVRGLDCAGVELLNANGIYNFQQLRDAGTMRLQQVFNNAGPQFSLVDPSDWTQQAQFAANGDWTGLADWQTANALATSNSGSTSYGSQAKSVTATGSTNATGGNGDHDLTKINGIGPATARFLRSRGISRFEQVANMSVEQLEAAISDAGAKFQLVDPATWPQQAQEALRDLQSCDVEKLGAELMDEIKEISEIPGQAAKPLAKKQPLR